MADSHAKSHDYHLVEPSPWPLWGSIGALLATAGGVWWMHGGHWYVTALGLLIILYTMFVWWRDVIREAVHEGHHTPVVQLHLRYGMLLFITSEVMFFVAWFWAYFNGWLEPTLVNASWPPAGVETFNPWHLPFMNTIILLTSSVTVTWAHHEVQEGNNKRAVQALALTVLLGLSFTCLQAIEYHEAPFHFGIPSGGDVSGAAIYGSTFFMATGFHGAHVIIGTLFLLVCLFRAQAGHFKPDHHFGLEAAAWYWHFVDVVWIFLFSFIYVWSSGSAAG